MRPTAQWSLSARIGYFTGPREPNGCRLWTAATSERGYAVIASNGKQLRVTRVILGLTQGDGRVAMHRCDNPGCVEPSHLLAGDDSSNQFDAVAKGRHHNSRATHCRKGHAFDSENTLLVPRRGHRPFRRCRTCERARSHHASCAPEKGGAR